MPNTIIYCALSCASWLVAGQHTTLHRVGHDLVESVSDEGLRAVMAKQPDVPILYFSQADYEAAMQGLTPAETDEAVQLRLKRWSPSSMGFVLSRVAEDERRIMTIAASLATTAQGSRAHKLQQHFSSGMSLVTSISATGRLDRLSETDLLSTIVIDEANLMAELQDPTEIAVHLGYAKALAEKLAQLGAPNFAQALPFADPEHGVWITPADESVRNFVRARDLPAVPWRGGIVTTISSRTKQTFEKRGNKVKVLYYDAGELLQHGSELTQAQMDRQFEKLAAQNDTARSLRREQYLDLLRLKIAIERSALGAQASRHDPVFSQLLDTQRLEETRILMRTSAQNGTWLQPGDQPASAERLLLAEKEMQAEVGTFLELARIRKDVYLQNRLQSIQDWKQADMQRLARSSEQ